MVKQSSENVDIAQQKWGWVEVYQQSSTNSIWKDRTCSCGIRLNDLGLRKHSDEDMTELYPIGSMYAIYGNIYHQYTPFMLAYIPAPWILWVLSFDSTKISQPLIRNPWSTTPSVPWMGLSQCRLRGPAEDASGNNFSLPNDVLLGYAIPGNLEHMSLVNTGQTLLMLWKL